MNDASTPFEEELDDPQGKPQWVRKRVGKATASRMFDLCARLKSGKGYRAERGVYLREVVFERLTDRAFDHYVSEPMRWGIQKQAEAKAVYQLITGREVKPSDFVDHPTIAMSGASPDGLVGDDGLAEFKCPTSATHIETLISETIPEEYLPQMTWQMDCTGRQWCDFVSYDPRLPAAMQFWMQRFRRDDAAIILLQNEVVQFLADVDETVAFLLGRYGSGDEA